MIKKVVSQTEICIVNTGKEKDTKTQGNLDFLLSVMNDSVPAMLDTFHLHKLLSHGRCSGICLHPAEGCCLASPKRGVMYYYKILF